MVEAAARTTASPAAIWAIVIVAVVLLVFWLTAITLADRSQARASGRALMPGGWLARDESVPQGETPAPADVPAQAAAVGRRAMPAQRTGDHDRAARSHAGPGTPDDEEPGR
jgi:hypothetical protein